MAVYRSQHGSRGDGDDGLRHGGGAGGESLDYTHAVGTGRVGAGRVYGGNVYGGPQYGDWESGDGWADEPPSRRRYGDELPHRGYDEPPYRGYDDELPGRGYEDRAARRRRYDDEADRHRELGFDRRDIRAREDYADYHDYDYDGAPRRPPPKAPIGGVRAGIRGLGELLITFGLVVLLFAGYEVWGKSAQVDAAQGKLDRKLEDKWGDTPRRNGKPLPGSAIARMYIPRLDKHWVVVEGVQPGDIKTAPGHYPDSAMAGKVGNFAVAGHRMPAVFWNLHKMRNGDPIWLEDRKKWYEYEVTDVKIVSPSAVEVVAPVPGRPGEKPTIEMLTITTCNPQWDNYERLIVHAKLTTTRPKSEGRPPGLPD